MPSPRSPAIAPFVLFAVGLLLSMQPIIGAVADPAPGCHMLRPLSWDTGVLTRVSYAAKARACTDRWGDACPTLIPKDFALPEQTPAETLAAAVRRNRRWIMLTGDSLVRAVYVSLVRYMAQETQEILDSVHFNKENYHNSRFICCQSDGANCTVAMAPRGTVSEIARRCSQILAASSSAFCVSWIWAPRMTRDFGAALNVFARSGSGSGGAASDLQPAHVPALIVFNQGLHGLVNAASLFDGINNMTWMASECQRRCLPCALQTLSATGYSDDNAFAHKHIRVLRFIAAYNAGVSTAWRGVFPVVDAFAASQHPAIAAALASDNVHYLPHTLAPMLAHLYLSILDSGILLG